MNSHRAEFFKIQLQFSYQYAYVVMLGMLPYPINYFDGWKCSQGIYDPGYGTEITPRLKRVKNNDREFF